MSTTTQATGKGTDWRKYNKSLVARGDITIWFSDEAIASWEHANDTPKVGRPFTFSDTAVECLLTIRELLQLPYRQTEGFGRSLAALLGVSVRIPNYSSIAKRAAKLNVSLDVAKTRGPIDLVVDSSGLKLFGEGEWKTRTYGASKRRSWRKVHLAVNAETQEIEAVVLTENSGHDADQAKPLLEQVNKPVTKFYGDGGYDKWKVYEELAQRGIEPVIPPQHNAKIKQHGNASLQPLPRDEAIRSVRQKGRSGWEKEVGYHRRNLAETAIYRFKETLNHRLKNRELDNQETEVRLRCKILNHFTHAGLP